MIPCAAIVAGPGRGVALRPGVRGAREDKWPLVGLQLTQAFVGSANIFHSIYVMDGAMIKRRTVIQAMQRVQRHGLVGALKKSWLVHVVPKSRNAHPDEILIECPPPVACSR